MSKWYKTEDFKPWEVLSEVNFYRTGETREYTPDFIAYFGKGKHPLTWNIPYEQDDIRIIRCARITYHYYNDKTGELENTEQRWLWDCNDIPTYWRMMVESPNDNNIITKDNEQTTT